MLSRLSQTHKSKHYILLLDGKVATEEEAILSGKMERGQHDRSEQDKRLKEQKVNIVVIHNILESHIVKKFTILFMNIQ